VTPRETEVLRSGEPPVIEPLVVVENPEPELAPWLSAAATKIHRSHIRCGMAATKWFIRQLP